MTMRYLCTHDALPCLAAPQGVPPLRFGEHGAVAAAAVCEICAATSSTRSA